MDTVTLEAVQGVQDQAYWAATAAVAAWLLGLIGLIVNGVGLALIWRQVKHGNAALVFAAETSRMAVLAERPWIKIRSDEIAFVPTPHFTHTTVEVALENVGKGPALGVEFWITQVRDFTESAIAAELVKRPVTVQVLPTLFPGDTIKQFIEADFPHHEGPIPALVAVVVQYKMAGATAPFRSSQVLMCPTGPGTKEIEVFEFPYRASCPT